MKPQACNNLYLWIKHLQSLFCFSPLCPLRLSLPSLSSSTHHPHPYAQIPSIFPACSRNLYSPFNFSQPFWLPPKGKDVLWSEHFITALFQRFVFPTREEEVECICKFILPFVNKRQILDSFKCLPAFAWEDPVANTRKKNQSVQVRVSTISIHLSICTCQLRWFMKAWKCVCSGSTYCSADSWDHGTKHVLVIWLESLCFAEDLYDFIGHYGFARIIIVPVRVRKTQSQRQGGYVNSYSNP